MGCVELRGAHLVHAREDPEVWSLSRLSPENGSHCLAEAESQQRNPVTRSKKPVSLP